MGVALIVVVLLNTYPLITSQDLIVTTKRDKLLSRANFIASTLSLSDYLSKDKVALAMEIYTVGEEERIVVCDASALSLYDSSESSSTVDKYLLIPEITTALTGNDGFRCRYTDQMFESRVSVPVMVGNQILGAVYVYESDSAQAAILDGIRGRMQGLSLVISLVLILVIFAFSTGITRRLDKLLNGIRGMRSGTYGATVEVEGDDEIRKLADEFNAMSVRLRDTEELRRTFVSDASHELRTPLSSIRLLTDSIIQTRDIDIDTAREFLADIGEEIDRLTRIAEKLLILTRLDGAQDLTRQPIDLKKTVEAAAHMLEPIAKEAGVALKTDLDDACIIQADPDGAHQIVFNLMENAVKYNKPGGYVHVILFAKDQKVSLIVDDTGIGIPREDYDRIFERFYRVDKARSRKGAGGTGLGLSIVLKNVQNFGGTIQVEPSAAGGTRFILHFPQVQEALPAPDPQED